MRRGPHLAHLRLLWGSLVGRRRWASIGLLGLSAAALAGDRSLYEHGVSLIQDRYVDVDTLDPYLAFEEAAEQAERVIPWLIVDGVGERVVLRHGQRGPFATLALSMDPSRAGRIEDLPGALERLEEAIRGAAEPIPAAIDLPVELIRGAARALDRHSMVLSQERLDRFDERISGKLLGVGARIGAEEGKLVIKSVFDEGPGAKAGLKVGDVLLRIDGVSTVGMDVDSAVKRIRGDEGSPITLHLRRAAPGGAYELDLTMLRAEVVVPNVEWELRKSGVGVIRIDHFSEQTTQLLRRALDSFEAEEAGLRGIIVDLRGNEGGSMIQSCRAADLFLREGMVLRTEGRGGQRVEGLLREYRAHPEAAEPGVPVVVLIDRGSASASEILAGALQRLDRTVLIGDRSHGKGTVQKLYTLRPGEGEDRARLKLTVGRYLLPGDYRIQPGVGLEPDLWLESATFSRGGVAMPMKQAAGGLLLVDEEPGWRNSTLPTGEDAAERVAERVLLETQGPTRTQLLAAIRAVQPALNKAEDQRLVDTFQLRGINWSPAPSGGEPIDVAVKLVAVDPVLAGEKVELRAEVTNQGSGTLHRLRVHLGTDDASLPWNDLVLPVGSIAPGEVGYGSVLANLSADEPDRADEISLTVVAHRRTPVLAEPAQLRVIGRSPPPLLVVADIVGPANARRLEVSVENAGDAALSNVRARVVLDEASRAELGQSELSIGALAAKATQRRDTSLRLQGQQPLSGELRLFADPFGRVVRLPFTLPAEGPPVRLQAPVVEGTVPLIAPTGPVTVSLRATDDQLLRSMIVWLDHEKIAWRPGSARRLSLDLTLELEPGAHSLVVDAEDTGGAVTRRSFALRGTLVEGAAAQGQPATP